MGREAHRSGWKAWTAALAALACLVLPGTRQAQAAGTTGADFNGDGYSDLAIGVPGEGLSGAPLDAGTVQVLYGRSGGLGFPKNQLFKQTSRGDCSLHSKPENDDLFGAAIAWGDFNADGYDELAIGVPNEGLGSIGGAGVIHVLRGTGRGLTTCGSRLIHQNKGTGRSAVADSAEVGDSFGSTLVAGDFDGDGFEDLAVAASNEDFGASPEDNGGSIGRGVVHVLFGSATGITFTGNELWHQDTTGVQGVAEDEEQFGAALGAGDFDGDGYSDLAVGVPGASITDDPEKQWAGAVNVLRGSATGLTATGDQLWHQDSATGMDPVLDEVEGGESFGNALAAGDFNEDGLSDLAIAASGEAVGDTIQGVVHALYGSASGLSAVGDELWYQGASDRTGTIAGEGQDWEAFGAGLTAGDFEGDGDDDLAVGVPGSGPPGEFDEGSQGEVNVLYGGTDGLSAATDQLWKQSGGSPSTDIAGTSQDDDLFGWSLTFGDFNKDGRADLAVGVPGEAVGGGVNVIYAASSAGLGSSGNQFWNQDSKSGAYSIRGTGEPYDWFGDALGTDTS